MVEYAMGECHDCYARHPKNQLNRIEIKVVSGRSGSSFGFFGGTRSNARGRYSGGFKGARWSAGRTYTSRRTVLVCDACLRKRRSERVYGFFGGVLVLILAIGGIMVASYHADSGNATHAEASTAVSADPAAEPSAASAASVAPGTVSATGAGSAAPASGTSLATALIANAGQDVASGPAEAATKGMGLPAPPAAAVETPASVLSQAPPSYPVEAMRQGARGEVVIDVSIAIDGSVVDATVEHSSGYRSLDTAAMQSIRRWRFNPALRDGQPVPTTLRIPIDFTPPVDG